MQHSGSVSAPIRMPTASSSGPRAAISASISSLVRVCREPRRDARDRSRARDRIVDRAIARDVGRRRHEDLRDAWRQDRDLTREDRRPFDHEFVLHDATEPRGLAAGEDQRGDVGRW
jgi:hypothetical protein